MCVMTVSLLTFLFFFFNDTATTEIYTLSLHDALPISQRGIRTQLLRERTLDKEHQCEVLWWLAHALYVKSLRTPRSEEHTSELQSQSNLVCRLLLEKKKKKREREASGVLVAELLCSSA